MSRAFRVYQKKRGHRRTGSGQFGRVGEALFFAFFLLAGLGGLLAILWTMLIPEWRVNHEFAQTTCTVLAKRLGETDGDDGPLYRPEITIRYEVDGRLRVATTYDICRSYTSNRKSREAVLARFEIGKQYPCWYDPTNHNTAVVVRGYSWWLWLVLVVPISFILLGGGGLLYCLMRWGKSAEQLAAARSGGRLERSGEFETDYPNLPPGADMTNSPGTRLRFRLPISATSTWILVGLLIACVAWNGCVAAFGVSLAADLLAGRPQWLPTLVMTPFALGGLALAFLFVRQLLITTGIGPTLLEISDHPLRPGETSRLFVSQAGRLRMNALIVELVCQEYVQYRQGTDTRTETQDVFCQELYQRAQFDIHRVEPLEVECEFMIPPQMMHSFKSDNNEVRWHLRVRGDVAGWPDFTRSFPVVVYPSRSDQGDEP